MYDIIVIGAGISGATFACKISEYAKTILIEAQEYNKEIPIRTNIFPEHNRPFIKEIDWEDKTIFPSVHIKSNYMSDEFNGIIDSTEFGRPLGNVCYTENLIGKLINKFEQQGGIFKSNEKISRVNKHGDHLELINSKGESYSTKLLILATGSRGFELQGSLGFEIPDHYTGTYIHLHGSESKINENLKNINYTFHINPKISTNGPFFFNKGIDRLSAGYLGERNQSEEEIISKLERILKNYKLIQPIVAGLSYNLSEAVVGNISKHPIKRFSDDRVLILGEAAGIVTAFFYEGLLPGVACADIAANTIKSLIEKESDFSRVELQKYDSEVKRILFTYFRNGNALEYLIYNDSSYVKPLWRLYTQLISENKTVRRYIYKAYINHDLSKHNVSNDRYVGEKLFGKLPALSKLTLSPKFFKAMLL